MKLTENFTLEEMCFSATSRLREIDNTPTEKEKENLKKLCREILQPIRDRFGKPIHVTSGYRCEVLNKIVGGSRNSQHLHGEAADIKSEDNRKLWGIIRDMMSIGEIRIGQLIDEKNLSWIHISLPDKRHENQVIFIV